MNDERALSGVLDLVMNTDTPRAGEEPVFHTASQNGGRAGLSGKQAAGVTFLVAGAALIGAGVFCGLQAQKSAASQFRSTLQVETGLGAALGRARASLFGHGRRVFCTRSGGDCAGFAFRSDAGAEGG